MTVGELIDKLQKFTPDTPVEISCTFDCGFGTAGGSIIQIIDRDSYIELYNDEC